MMTISEILDMEVKTNWPY